MRQYYYQWAVNYGCLKALAKGLTVSLSYSALVNPLTTEEYVDLKNSIAENGQYVPIIVNSNGIILDGHHRFRICEELGISPKFVKKDFENHLYEEFFVIDCNLKRRHLNPYQKGVLFLKKKEIMEKIAKFNSLSNLKQNKSSTVKHLTVGRVNEIIGKEAGLSHETIRKIQTIEEKATEEDKEKLNRGQKTINKIMMKPVISLPKNVKLFQGDFEVISKKIPDNSIDLIFTDPLYGIDGLVLYAMLHD